MIRRPPRSTLLTHSFPTRRSSDLLLDFHLGISRVSGVPAVYIQGFYTRIFMRDLDLITLRLFVAVCELRSIARAGEQSNRSEEHTSELQSLMRISYAVFCLKKKTQKTQSNRSQHLTRKTL